MFESQCTQPEEPSHRYRTYHPIMKGVHCGSQRVRQQIILEDDKPVVRQKRNDRARCGKKTDRSISFGMDDPKLKQGCFVSLIRLKMGPNETVIISSNKKRRTVKQTRAKRSHPKGKKSKTTAPKTESTQADRKDWKLDAKLSVCLKRLSVKPGCPFYCMEHQKRGCPCLLPHA